MLVSTKSLWTSKTFWLGVLEIAIGVMELIETEVLFSEGGGWFAVASGTLTIVLRYMTTQPVTVSGKGVKHVSDE